MPPIVQPLDYSFVARQYQQAGGIVAKAGEIAGNAYTQWAQNKTDVQKKEGLYDQMTKKYGEVKGVGKYLNDEKTRKQFMAMDINKAEASAVNFMAAAEMMQFAPVGMKRMSPTLNANFSANDYGAILKSSIANFKENEKTAKQEKFKQRIAGGQPPAPTEAVPTAVPTAPVPGAAPVGPSPAVPQGELVEGEPGLQTVRQQEDIGTQQQLLQEGPGQALAGTEFAPAVPQAVPGAPPVAGPAPPAAATPQGLPPQSIEELNSIALELGIDPKSPEYQLAASSVKEGIKKRDFDKFDEVTKDLSIADTRWRDKAAEAIRKEFGTRAFDQSTPLGKAVSVYLQSKPQKSQARGPAGRQPPTIESEFNLANKGVQDLTNKRNQLALKQKDQQPGTDAYKDTQNALIDMDEEIEIGKITREKLRTGEVKTVREGSALAAKEFAPQAIAKRKTVIAKQTAAQLNQEWPAIIEKIKEKRQIPKVPKWAEEVAGIGQFGMESDELKENADKTAKKFAKDAGLPEDAVRYNDNTGQFEINPKFDPTKAGQKLGVPEPPDVTAVFINNAPNPDSATVKQMVAAGITNDKITQFRVNIEAALRAGIPVQQIVDQLKNK